MGQNKYTHKKLIKPRALNLLGLRVAGLKKSGKNGGMPPEVFTALAEVFGRLMSRIFSDEILTQQKSSDEQIKCKANRIPLNISENPQNFRQHVERSQNYIMIDIIILFT